MQSFEGTPQGCREEIYASGGVVNEFAEKSLAPDHNYYKLLFLKKKWCEGGDNMVNLSKSILNNSSNSLEDF